MTLSSAVGYCGEGEERGREALPSIRPARLVEIMLALRTTGLFLVTASAEIVGCYAVYLVLRRGASVAYLGVAVVALSMFAWLLTLHPTPSGRTYAAYGGVYVAAALIWLWAVDHRAPDRWDVIGATLSIMGMLVIYYGPRSC